MLDFVVFLHSRGTYVLHLLVPHPQSLMIGRLGSLTCSSPLLLRGRRSRSRGSARVGRRLRGAGTLHWHIDYLRAVSERRARLLHGAHRILECAWSRALAQLPQRSFRFHTSDRATADRVVPRTSWLSRAAPIAPSAAGVDAGRRRVSRTSSFLLSPAAGTRHPAALICLLTNRRFS